MQIVRSRHYLSSFFELGELFVKWITRVRVLSSYDKTVFRWALRVFITHWCGLIKTYCGRRLSGAIGDVARKGFAQRKVCTLFINVVFTTTTISLEDWALSPVRTNMDKDLNPIKYRLICRKLICPHIESPTQDWHFPGGLKTANTVPSRKILTPYSIYKETCTSSLEVCTCYCDLIIPSHTHAHWVGICAKTKNRAAVKQGRRGGETTSSVKFWERRLSLWRGGEDRWSFGLRGLTT